MIQDAPCRGSIRRCLAGAHGARDRDGEAVQDRMSAGGGQLRALIAEGGDAIEAPMDGEEAITLLADLDAGATGSMTSASITDQTAGPDAVGCGRPRGRDGGLRAHPALREPRNRQCGFRSAKALMVEGGHRLGILPPRSRPCIPDTRRMALILRARLIPSCCAGEMTMAGFDLPATQALSWAASGGRASALRWHHAARWRGHRPTSPEAADHARPSELDDPLGWVADQQARASAISVT